jgi:hypothetical protein
MDELTRFARVLVERLGTQPGATAAQPVSVQAIRKEILPYRSERKNLGLSSVEDYETVLLRLVAEERGFVKTAPPDTAERCRTILAAPNPDLGVLEEIADTTIQFTSLAAGPVFEQTDVPAAGRQDGRAGSTEMREPSKLKASDRIRPPPAPEPSPSAEATGRPAVLPTGRQACPHCSGALPGSRTVVFCPWCGLRLIPLLCERCGAEFESGWRHCITCGAPVRDPYRPD